VKTWDVIVVGGGIIGMSLALELRRSGAGVLVADRAEPGAEASSAAAGMLAHLNPELPPELREMAAASAAMYPGFIGELERDSGLSVDLRSEGTIFLGRECPVAAPFVTQLSSAVIGQLEPALSPAPSGFLLQEKTLDPRALVAALLETARHRGVEFAIGSEVTGLLLESNRVAGVHTAQAELRAPVVVNCAGAWAGQIAPLRIPARPVKGHMLMLMAPPELLRHVIEAPEVYLVPRSDGRVLAGSTVEENGFDKHVDANAIQTLHRAAAILVPQLGEAQIIESWTGLRPGTPDDLPILGATSIAGYFVAGGHFRNGILLAPITARLMTQVIAGQPVGLDLSRFSPERFPAI
jgi:glycine oxidase